MTETEIQALANRREQAEAVTTTGTLLDWCPAGPILLIAGARTILGWDRIALIELAGD